MTSSKWLMYRVVFTLQPLLFEEHLRVLMTKQKHTRCRFTTLFSVPSCKCCVTGVTCISTILQSGLVLVVLFQAITALYVIFKLLCHESPHVFRLIKLHLHNVDISVDKSSCSLRESQKDIFKKLAIFFSPNVHTVCEVTSKSLERKD